jgi:uncharacterized membrane protein HdeD (DUF308 family)
MFDKNLEIDGSAKQLGQPLQPIPRSTLACSIVLLIVGTCLIIFGFIEEIVEIDPSRGIAFWVIGGLVFIPGVYYTIKIFQAYRAKDPYNRSRLLRDIPEI